MTNNLQLDISYLNNAFKQGGFYFFMDIKKVLDNFSKTKIAVVGDVILDSYIHCCVDRVNPEAPVLIGREEKETFGLGGAANVAANVSSLCGKAYLFGYTGNDKENDILLEKLREENINFELFSILEKTTKKTRFVADNQHQVFRWDRECYAQASEKTEKNLVNILKDVKPEVIIFSDYAKGCLTKNLFSEINKLNDARILVDPKPQNKEIYSEACLITPNLKEAREMSGLIGIEEVGRALQKKYKSNVLITIGKEGMSLFEGEKIINLPTKAREVYDVTGAGDTVIAVMGLGLASGLGLEESAFLANHAAGIVVGRAGTATISPNELEQTIESENIKLKDLKDLKRIREDYCRKGKKVIWTNGCFDILHPGHILYLQKAKHFGDCLVVGVNNDESVRKLKGKDRPILSEMDRAQNLAGLEAVNYVTIFSELTPLRYLKELKPDVYVKGGDYTIDSINQKERRLVESYGGKIEIISVEKDSSTTKIINRIRNGCL